MAARRALGFALSDVTGRPVSLGDYRGTPVVLIFGGRDSREEVRAISRAIGLRRGAAAPPLVLIVDLRGVPDFLHGMVRGALRRVHEEAVRETAQIPSALGEQPPADPAHLFVILPDWRGEVTTAFGLSGVDRRAVAVLLDGDGLIRGQVTGSEAGAQILALLD